MILWCSLTCLQFEAIIITCGAVEVLFLWGQTGAYETAINVLPAQLVLCWKNQKCACLLFCPLIVGPFECHDDVFEDCAVFVTSWYPK